MNLIGYWHSDDQIRVGGRERRVFDEMMNFAGMATKIAKITKSFLKGDNIQCEMDAVKKSNERWTIRIVAIIVLNIVGFAAVIFVIFRIFKRFEIRYGQQAHSNHFMTNYMETLVKEVEKGIEINAILYTTTPGEFTVG